MLKIKYRDEWLAALRSGEYKQGKSRLNGPDGFCCLGVYCDILAKKKIGEWETSCFIGRIFSYKNTSAAVSLPEAVVKDFGFLNKFGFTLFVNGAVVSSLASENDLGTSFKEIANIIEQNTEEGN